MRRMYLLIDLIVLKECIYFVIYFCICDHNYSSLSSVSHIRDRYCDSVAYVVY